jgi:hypothetical protein
MLILIKIPTALSSEWHRTMLEQTVKAKQRRVGLRQRLEKNKQGF